MTEFDDIPLPAFLHRRDDEYEGRSDDLVDDDPPAAPLPLTPAQARSLICAVDAGLAARGCDNTLRAAHAWARRVKIRWAWLRNVLESRGGFCDCEVMFNVVPPPEE